MDYYDIGRSDIAKITGRRTGYVTSRMMGTLPWDINEIYAICDYFNALEPTDPPMPYETIPLYFPKEGISAKPVIRRQPA